MRIQSGFAIIITLFLASGAHTSFANGMKEYELRSAAGSGNSIAVKKLLSEGAEINGKSNRGYTALITAARGNYAETVSLLIENGADVNAKDDDGDSAIMFAITHDNAEMMQDLLLHNADVNITDKRGATPLMRAASLGKSELVRLILSKKLNLNVKIDAVDNDFFSALMIAAKLGNLETVEILINAGADPDKKSSYGATALSLATAGGHTAIVKLLNPSKSSEGIVPEPVVSTPTATLRSAPTTTPVDPGKAAMRKAADRWFREAEEELSVAGILLDREKFKAASYHYQQCVELLFQVLILEKGEKPDTSRDLVSMLSRVQQLGWQVAFPQEDATYLNTASKGRYPTADSLLPQGEASKINTNRAAKATEHLLDAVRVALKNR